LAGSYQPIPGDWAFPENGVIKSVQIYYKKKNTLKKSFIFIGCINYREVRPALRSIFFGNNSCHGYIVLLANRLTSALKTARKKDCGLGRVKRAIFLKRVEICSLISVLIA
jgi:hypothetical protein